MYSKGTWVRARKVTLATGDICMVFLQWVLIWVLRWPALNKEYWLWLHFSDFIPVWACARAWKVTLITFVYFFKIFKISFYNPDDWYTQNCLPQDCLPVANPEVGNIRCSPLQPFSALFSRPQHYLALFTLHSLLFSPLLPPPPPAPLALFSSLAFFSFLQPFSALFSRP